MVATSCSPSVSSTFSRDSGAAAATSRTTDATASAAGDPEYRRSWTRAQSNAESIGASSVRSSETGSASASFEIEPGQPLISPLWLNNHWSRTNGATADSVSGDPTVPFRTAASTAPEWIDRARPGNDSSAQIGTLRRYRTGAAPSPYQPRPKPSALTEPPPRMSDGAQLWR